MILRQMLFTTLLIVSSKQITDVLILWKKISKEVVMTKKDYEYFENSTKR